MLVFSHFSSSKLAQWVLLVRCYSAKDSAVLWSGCFCFQAWLDKSALFIIQPVFTKRINIAQLQDAAEPAHQRLKVKGGNSIMKKHYNLWLLTEDTYRVTLVLQYKPQVQIIISAFKGLLMLECFQGHKRWNHSTITFKQAVILV